MRAGRLDRQIGISRYGAAKNQYGDMVEGYGPAAVVPAALKTLPGSERFANAEQGAIAPVVFHIRWTPELDPNVPGGIDGKDRIEFPPASGRFYDIASAIELGRHDTIEIQATVGTD